MSNKYTSGTRCLKRWALAGVASLALAWPAHAQSAHISFEISEGDLGDALNEYAIQSGQELIFVEAETEGKSANRVIGDFTPEEALALLLDGSGVKYRTNEFGTVLVGAADTGQLQTDEDEDAEEDAPFRLDRMDQEADRDIAVALEPSTGASQEGDTIDYPDTITVTGTSIRGVIPESSPLDIYDRTDFERLGITNVEGLLAAIPQNIGSTTSLSSNTVTRVPNARNINAPDLRGLGAGATLSLINGRRLPLANVGRAADVSLIPMGAIERVEVLTDGASSIYGADAVGGVMNFVLREDFEGALTSASITARGEGGYTSSQVDQTLGASWSGGGVVASLSGRWASPFYAADVDFNDLEQTTLASLDQRYTAFMSVHQDLGQRVELFADVLLSDRNTKSTSSDTPGTEYVTYGDKQQTVGTVGLEAMLTPDLTFDLVGTYGSNDDVLSIYQMSSMGSYNIDSRQVFDSLDITGKIDGTLFRIGDREFLFALGGGYLHQNIEFARMEMSRETTYGFGELQVPIIMAAQDVPFVQKLELNVSGRYTETSDFGDSIDPKVGLFWRVSDDFSLRSTWGEAFRAPELPQLVDAPASYGLLPVSSAFGDFPDPFSPDRSTIYFVAREYLNPDLGPEQSTALTAGFDYQPSYFEGLTVSGTYFNIDYTDRIAMAPQESEVASDPDGYAALISPKASNQEIIDYLTDSLGLVDYRTLTYDPAPNAEEIAAAVTHVIRNGLTNIAAQTTSGFDVTVDYQGSAGELVLDFGMSATVMLENEEQATVGSPVVERVDTITYPVDLRGRLYAGVSRNEWSGRVIVNYVDSYDNTSVTPTQGIDSWTTLDLVTSYQFSNRHGRLLDGVRLGLNVQNVFDEDPPFAASLDNQFAVTLAGVNYDSSNHNPFGRLFTISFSKDW